jgi:hypothetical protein
VIDLRRSVGRFCNETSGRRFVLMYRSVSHTVRTLSKTSIDAMCFVLRHALYLHLGSSMSDENIQNFFAACHRNNALQKVRVLTCSIDCMHDSIGGMLPERWLSKVRRIVLAASFSTFGHQDQVQRAIEAADRLPNLVSMSISDTSNNVLHSVPASVLSRLRGFEKARHNRALFGHQRMRVEEMTSLRHLCCIIDDSADIETLSESINSSSCQLYSFVLTLSRLDIVVDRFVLRMIPQCTSLSLHSSTISSIDIIRDMPRLFSLTVREVYVRDASSWSALLDCPALARLSITFHNKEQQEHACQAVCTLVKE